MSSFTFYNDQSMNNLNVNQLSASSLTVGELIAVNNLTISGDLAVNGQVNLNGTISSGGGIQRPLALSSYTGLLSTVFNVNTQGPVPMVAGENVSDFTASDAGDSATLPAASPGLVVIYKQSEILQAQNAFDFDCAGADVFATGSLAQAGTPNTVSAISTGGE